MDKSKKNSYLFSLLQVFLLFLLIISYLQLVAYLSARDLSEFKGDIQPPSYANSFHNSHGKLVFSRHRTIDDEFELFCVWTLVFLFNFFVLAFSLVKGKNQSWLSQRFSVFLESQFEEKSKGKKNFRMDDENHTGKGSGEPFNDKNEPYKWN